MQTITKEGQRTGGAPPPVPGCEYRTAGDVGVTGEGRVCGEAEGVQGKAKGQQVDAHRQAKLQQETAQEVVLSLNKGQKKLK